MSRIQSVVIALVVLALSAGVVFAGHPTPSAASAGLATATGASGKTVPVLNEAPGLAAEDEDTDTNEDGANADHPDNHGADVSAVAQTDCTSGDHDNHGGCVSAVAKDNNGLATATEHGKPSTPGKPSTLPSH